METNNEVPTKRLIADFGVWLTKILKVIVGLVLGLIGVGLFVGILMILAMLMGLGGVLSSWEMGAMGMSVMDFSREIFASWQLWVMWLSVVFILVLPLVGVLLLIFSLLLNKRMLSLGWLLALLAAWFVSIGFLLMVVGMNLATIKTKIPDFVSGFDLNCDFLLDC